MDSIEAFLDDSELGLTEKTVDSYRYHLKTVLLPFLLKKGRRLLSQVTEDDLRGWLLYERNRSYQRTETSKRRPIAASTLRNHYAIANRFFGWCVARDRLPTSPMEKVRAPKLPRPEGEPFTEEEMARILYHCGTGLVAGGLRDRAIILLMLSTGARADEVVTLTEASFKWSGKKRTDEKPTIVRLVGKGDKVRYVRVGRNAAQAVRDYLRVRPNVEFKTLWVTQRMTQMGYSTLDAMLKAVCKEAKVENPKLHRLRHTFATRFYQKTRDPLALQKRLGHAEAKTTGIYLASLGEDYANDTHDSPDDY